MVAASKNIKKPMPYEKKKSLFGYVFISLWLFGVAFYFVRPLIDAAVYSFSHIEYLETGYKLNFVGIANYYQIFRVDTHFFQHFSQSLLSLAYEVPVIIIFSFFIAIILNQKFRGRTVMRAIFFIPVIVASGVVISILKGDAMSQMVITGGKNSAMLYAGSFGDYLYSLGLPQQVINPVVTAASDIFNLTWKSGIQILILLAGMQTIPVTLYEASAIDGATGWENFWKITFPLVSPMLILVFVFSVIDSFTDYSNSLMGYILEKSQSMATEVASSMTLVYCITIAVIIGVIYLVANRFVFYQNDNG